MEKTKAFTILEILIVVVVLGVMASLAIPRYAGIVEKSRRNEAMHIFSVLKQAQEAYRIQCGTYASIGQLGELEAEVPTQDSTNTYFYVSDMAVGGTADQGVTGYSITLTRTAKGTTDPNLIGSRIVMQYNKNTFKTSFHGGAKPYPYIPAETSGS